LLTETGAATAQAQNVPSAQGENSWHSPSLRDRPATGPNGVIAAAETLTVNARMGADRKSGQPARARHLRACRLGA